jgi:hypothetical protein
MKMNPKKIRELLEFALGGLDHLSGDHELAAMSAIQEIILAMEQEEDQGEEGAGDLQRFYE